MSITVNSGERCPRRIGSVYKEQSRAGGRVQGYRRYGVVQFGLPYDVSWLKMGRTIVNRR